MGVITLNLFLQLDSKVRIHVPKELQSKVSIDYNSNIM